MNIGGLFGALTPVFFVLAISHPRWEAQCSRCTATDSHSGAIPNGSPDTGVAAQQIFRY